MTLQYFFLDRFFKFAPAPIATLFRISSKNKTILDLFSAPNLSILS